MFLILINVKETISLLVTPLLTRMIAILIAWAQDYTSSLTSIEVGRSCNYKSLMRLEQ